MRAQQVNLSPSAVTRYSKPKNAATNWISLPERGDLGRPRRQLFALLRKLGIGRALSVRPVRQERDADSNTRKNEWGVASVCAGYSTGSTVWLSSVWSVRSAHGAALQSQQIAARPVCECDRPRARVGEPTLPLSVGRSRWRSLIR